MIQYFAIIFGKINTNPVNCNIKLVNGGKKSLLNLYPVPGKCVVFGLKGEKCNA